MSAITPTSLPKSLLEALLSAISSYNPDLHEEQGGFIIERQGVYRFVHVPNALSGQLTAQSLYKANQHLFNARVGLPCIDEGWNEYASFHTHPIGYPAQASTTDLQMLFRSFPINFIYTHACTLTRYTYNSTTQTFEYEPLIQGTLHKQDTSIEDVRDFIRWFYKHECKKHKDQLQ